MAVTPATVPLPKGEPDIGKLNTFNGRTVQVTRYLQPRGMLGQMVVPPTEMSVSQITQLLTELPIRHGPGYYKFTVSDTGGTGDDVWMTRLGPPEQEAPTMALNGLPTGSNPNAVPTGEGVRHLGHGFYYDVTLGLLTTPWREIVPYSDGQPLPKQPASVGAAASTPWSGAPNQGGWGAWPANDSESATVRELKEQIATQNRQREMDKLRDDTRRAQDDTAKLVTAALEKMTSLLTARPTGPDPEVQRRLDEAERRAERAEQRAEEERREATRRLETQALTERFEKGLREANANKTDPMMPMLLQLMQASQSAATESVKAIQAASAATAQASERGVTQLVASMAGNNIGPLQLVQLLQTAKSDSADTARTLMETSKDLLVMQKETLLGLVDATGQGNQPPWVGVATAALDRLGTLGAALAERNAQQQAQQQLQAQQQAQLQAQQRRAMPAQQRQPPAAAVTAPAQLGASAPISVPTVPGVDRPGQVETWGRPEGTIFDQKAEEWVLTDGRRFKNTDVQTNGWKAVLTQPQLFGTTASIAQAAAGPMAVPFAGHTLVPAQAFEAQTVSAAPTLVSVPQIDVLPPAKPKKGKKKDEPVIPPPPANPKAYSIAEMQEYDSDEVLVVCQKFPDEVFFGPNLLPYVLQLREANLPPVDVAKRIAEAQELLKKNKIELPMAMDVLEALHVEVLVERLFPGATDEYRTAIIVAAKELFGIEDVEEDEAS